MDLVVDVAGKPCMEDVMYTRHIQVEKGMKECIFPWITLFIDEEGKPQLVSGVMTNEEFTSLVDQLK